MVQPRSAKLPMKRIPQLFKPKETPGISPWEKNQPDPDHVKEYESPQRISFLLYAEKIEQILQTHQIGAEEFPADEAFAVLRDMNEYLLLQETITPEHFDESIHRYFAACLAVPPPVDFDDMDTDLSWYQGYFAWRETAIKLVYQFIERNAVVMSPQIVDLCNRYLQDAGNPKQMTQEMKYCEQLLDDIHVDTATHELPGFNYIAEQVYKATSVRRAQLSNKSRPYEAVYKFLCRTGHEQAIREVAHDYVHQDSGEYLVSEILDSGVKIPNDAFNQELPPEETDATKYWDEVSQYELQKPGSKIITAILAEYGLTSEQYLDAWYHSGYEKNGFVSSHLLNLAALKEIEAQQEGGAWLLTNRFGIKNFARYPLELLLEQIERADDASVPYGLIVTAGSDYNGAFHNKYRIETKTDIREKAHALGMHTRAIECASVHGMARRLLMLEKVYGQGNVEFLYAEGHGTEQSIQLGSTEKDRLTAGVLGYGEKRTPLFFKPRAPILLESCSTGVKGGIAQSIASALDTEVTAPTEESLGVTDIVFTRDEQGILIFTGKHHFDEQVAGQTTTHKKES
jgi:hypothetical protein